MIAFAGDSMHCGPTDSHQEKRPCATVPIRRDGSGGSHKAGGASTSSGRAATAGELLGHLAVGSRGRLHTSRYNFKSAFAAGVGVLR